MKKIILILIILFCLPILDRVSAQPITSTFVSADLGLNQQNYISMVQEMKNTNIDTIIIPIGNVEKDCATNTYTDYSFLTMPTRAEAMLIRVAFAAQIKIFFGVRGAYWSPCINFNNGTPDDTNTDMGRLIAHSQKVINDLKVFLNNEGVSWTDPRVAGIYITEEIETYLLSNSSVDTYIPFFTEQSRRLKQYNKPILLSPWQSDRTDYNLSLEAFKNIISKTDVTIIAPQDSLGTGKTTTIQNSVDHFRALFDAKQAYPSKNIAVWANIETFIQIGSTLVPAPFDRIRQQIEAAKPYVSKMTNWIYQHTIMTIPEANNLSATLTWNSMYTPDLSIRRAKLRSDYLAAYGGAGPLTIPPSQLTNPPQQPTTQLQPQDLGPRYAACDLCGYCPPNDPPQSWGACQKCLYPDISGDPLTMESLVIDPETNLPPSSATGRQYTFLGCLGGGENSGGFTEEGAAGGVIQSLLNIIFSMAGGIAFLYLLYGAFTIATSQANPERLNYGRRVVYGAIAGLIFTLGSVFIVKFIASGILKVPGFSN